MPSAQKMLNRTDLVLPPQWANEGNNTNNPSNYGKELAANAAWTAPLQRAYLEKANAPEFQENDFAGRLDNQGHFQIWNEEQVTLMGRVPKTEAGLALLKWATQTTGSGKQGPNTSRTWLYSYKDAKASSEEIWCVFKGCKPLSAELKVDKAGGLMITLAMSCKYAYETKKPTDTSSAKAMGFAGVPTATVANEDEAVPFRFQDMGDLLYDPKLLGSHNMSYTNLPYRSISASIQWGQRKQDSNGSDRDLFVDYASRTISGSADVFKQGAELNEDAKAGKLTVAIWNIDKSETTADTHAYKDLGSGNNIVRIAAKAPGALGEEINVEYKIASTVTTDEPAILVRGKDITITAKSSGAEIGDIASALNKDEFANRLVTAATKTGGTAKVTAAVAKAALDNGSDNRKKLIMERFRWEPSNENLIDQSEATIESKSFRADTMSYQAG